VPHITWSADYFTTIVAIFGTTISPYLFFWQASQEAEDQRVDVTKQPLIDKHYGAQRNSIAFVPIPSSAWRSRT
jgi:Mn2+/Fe2+ NRAMP family transporter